jgi:hypothetical protein
VHFVSFFSHSRNCAASSTKQDPRAPAALAPFWHPLTCGWWRTVVPIVWHEAFRARIQAERPMGEAHELLGLVEFWCQNQWFVKLENVIRQTNCSRTVIHRSPNLETAVAPAACF